MNPVTADNGWVNTIDSDHPEVIAKAHQIIVSFWEGQNPRLQAKASASAPSCGKGGG